MYKVEDDILLTVSVVVVLIEGRWYVLEVAVRPDCVVHSIIQMGEGVDDE